MQEYICLDRGALQFILGSKNHQAVVVAMGTTNWCNGVNLRRVLKELQLVEESKSLMIIL